ncbi:hypothetical protein [Parasitella parasitica]|uniref:F-box domain-containing protein n=1 Tax=Parasitella parasitica TaxID=35722 RepID=A0A0B7NPG6_9FUNG|nr:hypothetical protein [Parasitella parasitica]
MYNKYVWKLCLSWTKQDIHHLERFFFDNFLFPNLRVLEFSNAAAQDHILYPMIAAAKKSLSSLNLSQCYCLSSAVIKPLLTMAPHQMESLVLYGCGKMSSHILADIIHRHCNTLKRIRLTDANDAILDAIQKCKKLSDLGLEHCSDATLSSSALSNFFTSLSRHQAQLTHLRLRDINSLTSQHLRIIANTPTIQTSLVHFDMSECNRIDSEGISWLATECIHLESLLLAYQEGVTNQAIQLFIQNCQLLKHVDVSGCRLLTDHAFYPVLNNASSNLITVALETLNISGLDQISPSLIFQLLNKISSLQELCLGVTYDLDEADLILQIMNSDTTHSRFYYLDMEKFCTICKLPSQITPPVNLASRKQPLPCQRHMEEENDAETMSRLPSLSTWNIPLL